MTKKQTNKEKNGVIDVKGYDGLLSRIMVLAYPRLIFARQHLANWEEENRDTVSEIRGRTVTFQSLRVPCPMFPALDGSLNRVPDAEYRTVLPDEKMIDDELKKTRKQLEEHKK